MANLVNAAENELLDGYTGVTQYQTPATTYLAAFTADPTETGSVAAEMSGNGYARKSLSGLFPAATGTGGSVSNDALVTFATATGDWSEATHMGVMESGTAATDDMIIRIPLDSNITITNGQALEFAIGDFTISAA